MLRFLEDFTKNASHATSAGSSSAVDVTSLPVPPTGEQTQLNDRCMFVPQTLPPATFVVERCQCSFAYHFYQSHSTDACIFTANRF